MSNTIKYSLDGGITWQVASQGIRVHFDSERIEDDAHHQLYVNVTHEGLICDVVDMDSGEVVGTRAEMADDIVSDLAD